MLLWESLIKQLQIVLLTKYFLCILGIKSDIFLQVKYQYMNNNETISQEDQHFINIYINKLDEIWLYFKYVAAIFHHII